MDESVISKDSQSSASGGTESSVPTYPFVELTNETTLGRDESLKTSSVSPTPPAPEGEQALEELENILYGGVTDCWRPGKPWYSRGERSH